MRARLSSPKRALSFRVVAVPLPPLSPAMNWLSSIFSNDRSRDMRRGQAMSSTHDAFSLPTSSPTLAAQSDAFQSNYANAADPEGGLNSPAFSYPPQDRGGYGFVSTPYVPLPLLRPSLGDLVSFQRPCIAPIVAPAPPSRPAALANASHNTIPTACHHLESTAALAAARDGRQECRGDAWWQGETTREEGRGGARRGENMSRLICASYRAIPTSGCRSTTSRKGARKSSTTVSGRRAPDVVGIDRPLAVQT